MRRCVQCDRSIDHKHLKAKFCNKKCRATYFNNKTAAEREKERKRLRCSVCLKPMNAVSTRKKICSPECRAAYRRRWRADKYKREHFGIKCEWCGELFDRESTRKKTCSDACRRRLRESRKGGTREMKLQKKYGLTVSQWDEILDSQGGVCAICRESHDRYHTDHDHSCCAGEVSCGKCVRGILCPQCNQALGLMRDDRQRLVNAIEYLS